MACYRPINAWRSRETNPETGKRIIQFSASRIHPDLDEKIALPCGLCVGCEMQRSRDWAVRCMHEASLHQFNCMITLTYDDKHLPPQGSLQLPDFQKFMKRLRQWDAQLCEELGIPWSPIRFFHCGEYGEKFARPHYHAILFGFDFADKTPWRKTKQGHQTWRSKDLEDLWDLGHSEIGSVTFESAAYIARYITKKQRGSAALAHYNKINQWGEITQELTPEYITMSRKPGIASGWFEKFKTDVYPSDSVIIKGQQMRPPKFYDRKFELAYPSDFAKLKRKRKRDGLLKEPEHSSRIAVKEQVQELKASQLIRGFEKNET